MTTPLSFNANWYLQQNPDVAAAIEAGAPFNAYEHFQLYGRADGRSGSPVFDAQQYLASNPDVAEAVAQGLITAWDHFELFGGQEGRSPTPLFNEAFYLQQNPDVAAAIEQGIISSAAQHFALFGQGEPRAINPAINLGQYINANPDIAEAAANGIINAFNHLMEFGVNEGRNLGNGVVLSNFSSDPGFTQALTSGNATDALTRVESVAPFLPTFERPAGWTPPANTPIPVDFVPPADSGIKLVVPPEVVVPDDVDLPEDVFEPVEPAPSGGGTAEPATFTVTNGGSGTVWTLSTGNGNVVVTEDDADNYVFTPASGTAVSIAKADVTGLLVNTITLSGQAAVLDGIEVTGTGKITTEGSVGGQTLVVKTSGGNTISGGEDIDTALYDSISSIEWDVDATAWKVTHADDAGVDTLYGIEKVIIGTGETQVTKWLVDKSNNGEFDTIQGAINAASANDMILVAPGEYAETITIGVAKSGISLIGPNAVVTGYDNGDDTWERAPEAVIKPTDAFGTAILVDRNANDVTIKGFTVSGDAGGATTTTSGILTRGNNTIIENNIVDGFNHHSVRAASWDGSQYVAISGIRIEGNLISDSQPNDNGNGHGFAIYTQRAVGDILNNQIKNVSYGVQIQPYSETVSDQNLPEGTLSGNSFEVSYRGIWLNYAQTGSAKWSISDNTVNAIRPPSGEKDGDWSGIRIENQAGELGAVFSGNVIDGNGAKVTGSVIGYDFRNPIPSGQLDILDFLGETTVNNVDLISANDTENVFMLPDVAIGMINYSSLYVGGTVSETITGGDGKDIILGGGGNDVLSGGGGDDAIYLNQPDSGSDTLVYNIDSGGHDKVYGFRTDLAQEGEDPEMDKLQFDSSAPITLSSFFGSITDSGWTPGSLTSIVFHNNGAGSGPDDTSVTGPIDGNAVDVTLNFGENNSLTFVDFISNTIDLRDISPLGKFFHGSNEITHDDGIMFTDGRNTISLTGIDVQEFIKALGHGSLPSFFPG